MQSALNLPGKSSMAKSQRGPGRESRPMAATSDTMPDYGTPEYEQLIAAKMEACNFRREDAIDVIEAQRVHDAELAGVKNGLMAAGSSVPGYGTDRYLALVEKKMASGATREHAIDALERQRQEEMVQASQHRSASRRSARRTVNSKAQTTPISVA